MAAGFYQMLPLSLRPCTCIYTGKFLIFYQKLQKFSAILLEITSIT